MLRKLPHRLHVLSSLETFFFFPTKICTMSSANLKVTLQRINYFYITVLKVLDKPHKECSGRGKEKRKKMLKKLLQRHVVFIKHQFSLFNIYDALILVLNRIANS